MSPPDEAEGQRRSSWLALGALGIVYGDLGTSPLYTLQTVVQAEGGRFNTTTAIGVLSLIVWTLIITVSVKYAGLVMRADNHGEGGILALMSMLGGNSLKRPKRLFTLVGLAGAALLYGDGVITPSISVLSALEGLNLAAPSLKPYILPAAILVLAFLFVSQKFGSARIGTAFGPIMLLWFGTIAVLGISGIVTHPEVLVALNPLYAIRMLMQAGPKAVGVLGGVFLCVTGCEALYADMGHFGKFPIRLSWFSVVFPSLLLNYAGQTALLLKNGQITGNPFFQLSPSWFLYPLIFLATLATIIASQSIITGAFSMTRQAMQLGWIPGLRIRQTSDTVYGQIYVPVVNALMMVSTIAITAAFGSSDRLASAYGTAVSTTMLLTTVLLIPTVVRIWRWNKFVSGLIAIVFLIVDGVYFGANLAKFSDGGWLPLTIGLVIFLTMIAWRLGRDELVTAASARARNSDEAIKALSARTLPRTKGIGVFLSRPHDSIPPFVLDHVAQVGALQRTVLVVSVVFDEEPRIDDKNRASLRDLGFGIKAVSLCYGFVEIPRIPATLITIPELAKLDLDRAIYFAQRDRVAPKARPFGIRRARLALFTFLYRNSVRAVDRFTLPINQMVEIGREIEV